MRRRPSAFRASTHPASGVAGAAADRRIAGADDEQIALDDPVDDRRRRPDDGLEPIVPPDRIDGRGEAHQLGGRRRHEQRARIQLEEALVAIERVRRRCPTRRAARLACRCRRGDVLSELLKWVESRGDGRERACAQPNRPGAVKHRTTARPSTRRGPGPSTRLGPWPAHLLQGIHRLDRLVEGHRVNLRRARLVGAAGDDVGAGAAERDRLRLRGRRSGSSTVRVGILSDAGTAASNVTRAEVRSACSAGLRPSSGRPSGLRRSSTFPCRRCRSCRTPACPRRGGARPGSP